MRTIITILIAYAVVLALGPVLLPLLHKLKFGQPIRDDGPKSHAVKAGTPTMGGILLCAGIAVAALASMLMPPPLGNARVLPGIGFALLFALIGFWDDYLKVVRKNPKGLRAWHKIGLQTIVSLGLALFLYSQGLGKTLYLPFAARWIDMGLWYIPFVMFVAVAVVNSANLTDGLDGLLSGVSLIAFLFFALVAVFGDYIVSAMPGDMQGMGVLAGAGAGACLGFLRYNTHPARVFMGDSGSFLLGGLITYVALISNLALLLPLVCISFVGSALSDIIQIGYFKLSHGKRVFRMAPLHHHFELGGMPETQVVGMYKRVTLVACLIALALFMI